MLFLIPNHFTWWQTQLFAAKGDYVSGVSGINDLTVIQGKVKQKERKTGAVKMAEQLPSGGSHAQTVWGKVWHGAW